MKISIKVLSLFSLSVIYLCIINFSVTHGDFSSKSTDTELMPSHSSEQSLEENSDKLSSKEVDLVSLDSSSTADVEATSDDHVEQSTESIEPELESSLTMKTTQTDNEDGAITLEVSEDDKQIEKLIENTMSDVLETSDEKEAIIEENLTIYEYEAPLKLACETKKLICHNVSSNVITIQGSRKGSAILASFDSSALRKSEIASADLVSAEITVNKMGGTRSLPIRIDVLNLSSISSPISKSSLLDTYRATLPAAQNVPVKVDLTQSIRQLLDNASDPESFIVLISAHSRTRFGDILTFPMKEFPDGLSLKLRLTKLPESSLENPEPQKEVKSLRDSIFVGSNWYIAVGFLATVVVIVIALMMM